MCESGRPRKQQSARFQGRHFYHRDFEWFIGNGVFFWLDAVLLWSSRKMNDAEKRWRCVLGDSFHYPSKNVFRANILGLLSFCM